MSEKPTLTADQFRLLWTTTVDSKAFELQMELQSMQQCFEALVDAGFIYPSDKISLVDRDLKMLLAHVRTLVSDVTNTRSVIDNFMNNIEKTESVNAVRPSES